LELYAQTVVRADYYASEELSSESYQVAQFNKDIARQAKILHPDIKDPLSLRLFEPKDNDMFCEFHNSSLFNSLQTNLWQRIRKAIDSTLALDDRVDLHSSPSPKGRFLLKHHLDQMSPVFKTNYIPIFDPQDFEPEDFEPDIPELALPGDTPCPGCHISWFCSDYDWSSFKSLMVVAIFCRDDDLLGFLKMVAEIRCNTELCQEYLAVLPQKELFLWGVYLPNEVYEQALMTAADIQSKISAGVRYGSAKI